MRDFAAGAAKRVGLEILGWTVLVLGVLALFLPGPGLLLTFAGLAILSSQYAWAKRLTHPVKMKALRGAAQGVATIPRILLSALAALALVAVAVLWFVAPPAPAWWPLEDRWWLFGGHAVGVTMVISSVIAVALLIYSVWRFYGKPEAVAEIDRMDAEHKQRVARAEHAEALEAQEAADRAERRADASEAFTSEEAFTSGDAGQGR